MRALPVFLLTLGLLGCQPRVLMDARAPSPFPAPVEEVDVELPAAIFDFALLDADGKFHQLSRYSAAPYVVVYVTGNGCPIVRQNLADLQALAEAKAEAGVVFLGLNANPQDDTDSIRQEAEAFGMELPILKDTAQLVSEGLGIDRTGEALIIDPEELTLLWRGPLDDRMNYGGQLEVAKEHYLRDALDALLDGGSPAPGTPEAKGCKITFVQPKAEHAVDYAEHVAPLVREKCATCHRDGGVAPFTLDKYAKVKGWSEMMAEAVLTMRMPPWHADPAHGDFQHDVSLSVEEQRDLVHWVRAGAPESDSDPLAASDLSVPDWPLGEPDVIIELPPQEIPKHGVLPYRVFDLDYVVPEDQWVSAAVFRPSAPEVMHHAFVFARFPRELRHLQDRANGGLSDFFAAYVPGIIETGFPEGTGKRLPRDTTFRVQLHYTPIGRAVVDRPVVGLYLHDEPPPHELKVSSAVNRRFRLEPHSQTEVSAIRTVPVDAVLYGVIPHMHYRGHDMKFTLQRPDGSEEVLLSVPNYDMFWQRQYMLEEPLEVEAGSVIYVSGSFDNTAANPYNPDPDARVRFGEQTTDEMFIGYLLYRFAD